MPDGLSNLLTIVAANIGLILFYISVGWKAYRTRRNEWAVIQTTLNDHTAKLNKPVEESTINSGTSMKDGVLRIDRRITILEALYLTCMDHSGACTMTLDESGKVKHITSAYYRLTGLSLEQTQDWGWRKAIHPDDLDEVIADWNDSLKNERTFHRQMRFVNVHDPKMVTTCVVTCSPVHTGTGKISGWITWIKPVDPPFISVSLPRVQT